MSSGHHGQKHVYGDWPEVGVDDEEKRMLAEQVRSALIGSSYLISTHIVVVFFFCQ